MQIENTSGLASHVGPGWREADHHLRRLASLRAGIDAEEMRWLRVARDTGLHRQYGFVTLMEYMERVLGYAPHVARERLRVADALGDRPAMEEALVGGRISYSAARELTRVATPDTERAWLAATEGCAMRQVEELVAGRQPGDLPGDDRHPELVRHRLRFEVPAATFALFREARRRIETDAGRSLDEHEVFAEMCRAVLGSGDEGRAHHQIAITTCDGCGRAWQDGAGRAVEVPAVVLERAACDAQVIGRVDGERPERARQEIPPAVRRLVYRRDHGRCAVPGCRSARWLDIHHVRFRSQGGSDEPGNLTLICSGHHDAVHEGRLSIEGTAPELRFTRADGQPYESPEALAGPSDRGAPMSHGGRPASDRSSSLGSQTQDSPGPMGGTPRHKAAGGAREGPSARRIRSASETVSLR